MTERLPCHVSRAVEVEKKLDGASVGLLNGTGLICDLVYGHVKLLTAACPIYNAWPGDCQAGQWEKC